MKTAHCLLPVTYFSTVFPSLSPPTPTQMDPTSHHVQKWQKVLISLATEGTAHTGGIVHNVIKPLHHTQQAAT